jgi:acyl dehydratase
MTIDYDTLMNWSIPTIEQRYTEKDSILYALALGLGSEPTNNKHLQFVYESGLQALPSMAVVLGYPGFWMKDPGTGINWVKLLHGEQRLTIHQPLQASDHVIGRSKIKSVIDKGREKGTIVVTERALTQASTGALLATIQQVSFLRGDGGYSESGQPSDTLDSYPSAIPDAPADDTLDFVTRPEMALIYRLCADDNPLHADPAVARQAGFDRPILHGLASYGLACRAILQVWCDSDPKRLKQFNVRFTSPVYPGETIRVESWSRKGEIGFRAWALERNIMVINNGYARVD